MFSQEFLVEIKSLALQIAKRQRGEDHMQSFDVLHQKFLAEKQELKEASQTWDELPDVAYYAACMQIVLDDAHLPNSIMLDSIYPFLMHCSRRWKFSIEQLEAATLAKYRMRASRPKDIVAERTAILAAIAV